MSPIYQLNIVFLLLVILTGIAVTYYRVLLKWNFQDALLQVVLTISTLGGAVHSDAWSDSRVV
jgi:hypothetical protein